MNNIKPNSQQRQNGTLPKLIEDGPAPQDDFGSHKRIALGISSLIQNQKGGHVIGLRGPYGSGKSTTVSELRKILPNNNWKVITFDAWTHRGHDLMRAFLANIVKQLTNEIGETKASKIREDIINETEIKTTQTQSTVNAWGQSLVAIGILAAVISSGMKAASQFGQGAQGFSISKTALLWLGWTPWSLFLTILIVAYLWPWPQRAEKKIKFNHRVLQWIKNRVIPEWFKKYIKSGGFSIRFINEGERIQTTTTSSSAANSITFQDRFNEIINFASENKDIHLVIVLDNMDRLEEDDQLTAWSTIQAFVDAEFDLKENVWFLVPLSHIYPSKKIINQGHKQNDCIEDIIPDKDRTARLRKSLAEKIFLTEFRVPEVVLTDWVEYVYKLCNRVLSGADEISRKTASGIIVAWTRNNETRPNPRRLRSIVNQIGSLVHQWKDQIDLGIIALYVVNAQELEEKGKIFSDLMIISDLNDAPGRTLIKSKNISKQLAMLHFSAPENKALQVLVHSSFTEAMMSGRPLTEDGIKIPSIEILLDHVAHSIFNETKPGSVTFSIASCLDDAESRGANVLSETWDFLIEKFIHGAEPWNLEENKTLELGSEKLAAHAKDRNAFDKAFANQISLTIRHELSENKTN